MPLKLVWSYDCNPPEYRYRDGKPIPFYDGDKRHRDSPNKNDGNYLGPSQVIATPAYADGRVYVAIGQDPAHGRGRGMLHCIDATREGEITDTGRIWTFDRIERTMATVAIADGCAYVPDLAGTLYCLDSDTGVCHWTYDTQAETWGGVLVADEKLFLVNKKYFFAFGAGKALKPMNQILLGSPAYSTPVAANGVLYIASRGYLWAVQQQD
jgi:outer membrane protein assembly factor BamB